MHRLVVELAMLTDNPLDEDADTDCDEPLAKDDGCVKVIVCDALLIVMLNADEVADAYVTPAPIVTVIGHVPAFTIVTTPVDASTVQIAVSPELKDFVPSASPALAELTTANGESPYVFEAGLVIEMVREVSDADEIVRVPVSLVTV